MHRLRFERLVRQAITDLPESFLERMENVDVVVEDVASRDQIIGSDSTKANSLLGLYEGIPLTGRYGYDMVLPDKITSSRPPSKASAALTTRSSPR